MIQINPGSLPGGKKNHSYNKDIHADHGASPYTFTVSSGSLPPGLELTQSEPDKAMISGTPTALGTFPFTVTVKDANGCSGNRSYTIVITAH
jgi:hypothetical protein